MVQNIQSTPNVIHIRNITYMNQNAMAHTVLTFFNTPLNLSLLMPTLRVTLLSFSASLLFFVSLDISAEPLNLQLIEVSAERENLIGLAASASEGVTNQKRIENMPLSRSGEVLEQMPGLIVSQHSGDGKANQYYLRGFNLDHGTDFAVWLDGMPLNMRTTHTGKAILTAIG